MRFYKVFVGVLIAVLLFGVATIANADDPPKSANDLLQVASDPPPVKGSFDPVPIHPSTRVLDPATASVTRLELTEDGKSLVPATPTAAAPGPMKLRHFDGETFHIISDRANIANELLVGSLGQGDSDNQGIGPAASTEIRSEGFEGVFPGPWARVDGGGTGHLWGDVPCFERSGSWAAWPASEGSNGLNPCSPAFADYPNDMDSWLIFGDFSLADAQSASLDFFFRIESESCCDSLFWGTSTNGTNFTGSAVSGIHTSGPFNNGYNFTSLDLSNLAGQPQVWIGFNFESDFSLTDQGPFIDDIILRKNTDPRLLLTNENFDVNQFPNSSWQSFDLDGATNGEYFWDDVAFILQGPDCPSRSGSWSMWPADEGANGLNACQGNPYADNMKSWMVHGPFSLVGASEAWIDFYFRNVSQPNDFLFWGVSTNGFQFWGTSISGDHTEGPHSNGYNLMRLNLGNAPSLGDLRGESEVWLAFVFESDGSGTAQGPFIDDVSVVVERSPQAPPASQIFLPIILANLTPKTNLFINNQTGQAITNYTVKNPRLNGVLIPNIVCANIPAGATKHNCNATFDTRPYNVTVTAPACDNPTASGQANFNAGDDVRLVACVTN